MGVRRIAHRMVDEMEKNLDNYVEGMESVLEQLEGLVKSCRDWIKGLKKRGKLDNN